MENYTILIIEDEPTINRIISNYFIKEKYHVLNAYDGESGIKLFNENKVDIICLDIMMPKVNGWKVAQRIRRISDVPIIIMSALSEEEDILKGYSLKADDYITKPFPPNVLVAKIKNLLEKKRLANENNKNNRKFNIADMNISLDIYEENRQLKELLIYDDLTKISNRRYLNFYLNSMKDYAKEFETVFGLLFLDIDKFKNFNDTFGHNIGDEILKLVAKTISTNIRDIDLVGRWGGEEFVAIIKVQNNLDLEIVAEKLRILISQLNYKINKNNSVNITVSIGGTLFIKDESINSLVKRADSLMYYSKKNGRNKVTIK